MLLLCLQICLLWMFFFLSVKVEFLMFFWLFGKLSVSSFTCFKCVCACCFSHRYFLFHFGKCFVVWPFLCLQSSLRLDYFSPAFCHLPCGVFIFPLSRVLLLSHLRIFIFIFWWYTCYFSLFLSSFIYGTLSIQLLEKCSQAKKGDTCLWLRFNIFQSIRRFPSCPFKQWVQFTTVDWNSFIELPIKSPHHAVGRLRNCNCIYCTFTKQFIFHLMVVISNITWFFEAFTSVSCRFQVLLIGWLLKLQLKTVISILFWKEINFLICMYSYSLSIICDTKYCNSGNNH